MTGGPTAESAAPDPAQPVDLRHSIGAQVGAHNVQHIHLPAVEVRWPVLVGVIPHLADCYQVRPESEELRVAVRAGGTAVVTQVLAGLGGVGKSQLAAAFAREREDDLHVLMWVDARSRAAILAAYAQAAERLGFRRSDLQEAADWFLAWLRTARNHPWLIVLDDVADPADLRGLWPDGPLGSTVVTTRRTDAAMSRPGRLRIAVGLFSPEQGCRYLTEKLAAEEDASRLDEVDQLVEDLQFLPLALAQAAAFMLDRDETCAGYRRRFADRRRTLVDLFPDDALADDYRATVATTWAISVEAADALAPSGLSRPLLEMAGMLSPNGFAEEILRTPDAATYLGAHTTSITNSGSGPPRRVTGTDCRDALRNLARLSLVSINQGADGTSFVAVHALVQRATLERVESRRRHELVTRTASALLDRWPAGEEDRSRSQLFRANTAALLQGAGDALWAPAQHPLLARAGNSWRESGLVHEAASYWRQFYRTSERVLGSEHPNTLADRHEYAGALRDRGDLPAAIAELEQLLLDEIRVLEAGHPEILTTRHSLGTFRGEAGHFAQALAELDAILPARVRILGPDDRDTLTTRANMARFRGESGEPERAVGEYQQVVEHRTRALGADDRDTLHARSGLAYWKGRAGNPQRAAREFAALAADFARVLHPDDRHTLTARHDAAKWMGSAGDAAGAAAALQDLVQDEQRVLGDTHPDTIATRGSHADWVGEAGEPRRAVMLLQDVVADMIRNVGPTDLDTFTCGGNLAYWQWQAGNRDDAVQGYRRLLADMGDVLGGDNPRVLQVRRTLAGLVGDNVG